MRLLLNITVLSVIVIDMCGGEYSVLLPPNWEHVKYQRKSCIPSDEQMKLIAWYFERVNNYMEVTEIVPENDFGLLSKFTSNFLNHLNNYIVRKISVFTVNYKSRVQMMDEYETNFRTYEWHDEHSQGINETHRTEQIEKLFRMKYPKCAERADSPDFASIVLIECIETLDLYLNARTRHPFKHKRANYVLLIYRETDSSEWDELARRVLTKLWQNHGILNAIILSTCMPNKVSFLAGLIKRSFSTFIFLPISLDTTIPSLM